MDRHISLGAEILGISLSFMLVLNGSQAWAQCFDDGCTGQWGGGSTHYILSGGPNPTDELSSDDQLNFCVNGQRLYCDGDTFAGSNGTIEFTANPGDILLVTAYDYYGFCRGRSAVWAHSGDGQSQMLIGEITEFCANTAKREAFGAASARLPAWTVKGLSASLETDLATGAVGDVITATLTVTNTSDEDISNVHPDGVLAIAGDGGATQKSGPEPADPVALAKGTSTQFTFRVEATKTGSITLAAAAYGQKADNSSVASPAAQSAALTLVEPFKIKDIILPKGSHSTYLLVPANLVSIIATIEKQSVQPVDPGSLKVTLSKDEGLIRTKETADGAPPDMAGDFVISMTARVEDERNTDIFEKLLRDRNLVPLDDGITFHIIWTRDGLSKSIDLKATPKDESRHAWWIDYPDFSTLTGEPPLITLDPAAQTIEHDYYAKGNQTSEFTKTNPDYRNDPLVRKWALRAIRVEDDDYAPTTAKEASENIAHFLGARIGPNWQGDGIPVVRLAATLEAGAAPPRYPCISFATTVTGLARVVGIRSREIDNALLYVQLAGPWWAQHATSELWYDGEWHWFDLFFSIFGGAIREDGYPQFYLNSHFLYFQYRYIRSFCAVSEANLSDFALVGDGSSGFPGNFNSSFSEWRLYKSASNLVPQIHVNTYSPVTTLFTDSQGRRLGAAGPVTEADYYTKDKLLPLTGGNSFWEIPGAAYIAPGTPATVNTTDPNAVRALKEALILPPEAFIDHFTLTFTGTGDGPFEVEVWMDGDNGPIDLWTYSGNITTGQSIAKSFTVDSTGSVPVVAEKTETVDDATDNGDSSGAPVPTACGAGLCGTSAAAMMPFMLIGLGYLRRRST